MVWINGCPKFSIELPIEEDILDVLHIEHTPLIATLTKTSVFIFNQFTLLPLSSHVRNPQSIETNGYNVQMRTKHVSVNTAKFQKLNTVNLFIHTDSSFIIIYQISINYSSAIFQVHNNKDELIQTGMPLCFTPSGFSITSFFKSATKSIIHGSEEISVNLENIENVNNCAVEDDINGFNIEPIKLSIFKILKIGIGLKDFWLQQNSHNLFIYNNQDDKNPDSEKMDFLQIVNILNFKTKLFGFLDFEWYTSDSKVKYIAYNEFFDYFLFVNENLEIWCMVLDEHNEKNSGYKVGKGDFTKIWFNPQSNLLIAEEGLLKVYSIQHKHLQHLKDLDVTGEITWSPCGTFFSVLDESGCWKLMSRFGNVSFDSQEILNELDESNDPNRDFLKSDQILISGNASNLYVLTGKNFYYVSLLRSDDTVLYDNEYLSIVQNNKNFIRFPLLPRFKKVIANREFFNGTVHQNSKCHTGLLTVGKSKNDRLSLSYGDYLAISTPYKQGDQINHILWYNFRSHFADSLNIIHHFWFRDFLIVINRRSKHIFEENEEVDDILIDEFIVLDASKTRYGMSGEDVTFSSDLLLWKYDFKSTFTDIQLNEHDNKEEKGEIVILTADQRLIVLDLALDKTVKTETEVKHYKLYVSVNKTVHLSTIKHKINLDEVVQTSMIDNKHFLFLLATGDFYLLKNQTRTMVSTPVQAIKPKTNNNMYDLIKLHTKIEFFKFKTIQFEKNLNFVYLFNGEQILIYEIEELIEKAFDKSSKPEDVLNFEEEDYLLPICIETGGMQPFEFDTMLDDKSLDLVGLETMAINKHSAGGLIIKNKISHKLILNNFIEFDLLHKGDLESSFKKYKHFKSFHYCLELLLFKHLTDEQNLPLKRLFHLIEFTENSEFIYINCLRKIEIGYWHTFFNVLETTPEKFMNRLIEIDNVELCYNYLIIYLNYKHEGETDKDELHDHDKEVILKIISMLDKAGKWDWCFELCRFVKILDPSGSLLIQIKNQFE
ncbi:RIC1 Guanine nucleotide exchange factor subunit RIC1 [Candida maltosa Xu316]|uniref:RIC1 C-terminal alpha solenoid region domain-containing protein n=1 Tax=Candida maltosa (strain Xu316) TaxID=1245528 RepID=M3HHG8_CANMX|nr:hypothetical protein G210_2994 [Candida maltosa Xu316]